MTQHFWITAQRGIILRDGDNFLIVQARKNVVNFVSVWRKRMRSRLFWSAIVFVCLSSSAHAGFLEICKDSFPAGALTGLFSFTIDGQSGTFETPVGACTPAIELPDGLATIFEVPRPGAMFLSVFTFPLNRLVSFDPILGSAIVQIVPGDISTQTVVTFTNTPDEAPVPEPASVALVSIGLLSLILRGRRSRKQAA